MADEKASSLLGSDEQNQSVEMEFKVTDLHDEITAGWRVARISDVEAYLELVKTELCGMTFNICSLEDGTIAGPGLGYQITKMVDNTLHHKLLITDPLSDAVLADMKPDVIPDESVSNGHSANGHSKKAALLNDKCSTEKNGVSLDSNETLPQTNIGVESPIKPIDNDIDTSENVQMGDNIRDNIVLNDDTCGDDTCGESLSDESPVKVDVPQSIHNDNGSGNDSEVSEATSVDTLSKPSISDLESNKSESSPSTRKKRSRPMSASMQRLTARKDSSPDKRGTDLMSATERKAKADDLRKKKIEEQRAKDEERRAAVLERRKKLEAAEREKKEALFKRLTTKDSGAVGSRPSPMKGRYSLSTSNLTQLKKNKPVDLNITTVPKTTENRPRTSLAERPKSAMQRPGMGYPPQKTKSFNSEDRKKEEIKRPMTAFGSKPPGSSKPSTRPSPRQSLNVAPPARPSTSLGISTADKRKPLSTKQRNASTERLPTTTARKPITKAKSTSSVEAKPKDTKTAPSSAVDKKKPIDQSKPKPPRAPTPSKEKRASTTEKRVSTTTQSPRKPSTKKSLVEKPQKKEQTKEEAKLALALRRKKAKEEAEEKAREDREKDEVERVKREEDEKRLAEQLRLEEERQAALLGQLKKEEEERKLKMIEEKEQKERDEKERLEEDQRLREEEIDRKAKVELDKIQKEQERQEELLEQERIERKKRVEMIMARVSSKRTTGTEDGTEELGTMTPPELSNDPARLKVDDILRSRGFGKSTEDISKLLEKREEATLTTTTESIEPSTESTTQENETIVTENKSEVVIQGQTDSNESSQTLVSIVDTSASMENGNGVPLDESPTKEETSNGIYETQSPVLLEEAPSTEDETSNGAIGGGESNETTTKSDDINNELCENIDELKLTNDIENVTLNDTNNNKDFLVDNTMSSPITAWSENGNGHTPSQHESSEKIQNHAHSGGDDGRIFLNGNQDETKVVNGSSDLHITPETECEENSVGLESKEWNKFDEKMKQIQPPTVEPVAAGEEKLWKVLEGKVEMSECF